MSNTCFDTKHTDVPVVDMPNLGEAGVPPGTHHLIKPHVGVSIQNVSVLCNLCNGIA